MKEEDKKEVLLKRLKIIEDENIELLKTTGNKTDIRSKIDFFDKDLTPEAITLTKEIKTI